MSSRRSTRRVRESAFGSFRARGPTLRRAASTTHAMRRGSSFGERDAAERKNPRPRSSMSVPRSLRARETSVRSTTFGTSAISRIDPAIDPFFALGT